jgi:hypothetical protein
MQLYLNGKEKEFTAEDVKYCYPLLGYTKP